MDDKLPNEAQPVEVSPAMLDAGVRAFERWEDSSDASARRMVEEVYRAMESAR